MKKNLILLLVIAIVAIGKAQIVYDGSYNSLVSIIKLHQSGYKYVTTNNTTGVINLYNINHSLWKTITVPTQTVPILNILYISENLFDTDNQVEYLISMYASSVASPTSMPSVQAKVAIYKENGTLLFMRDSASCGFGGTGNAFGISDGVFDDGTGAKLRLGIYPNLSTQGPPTKFDVYDLPGTIPCISCNSQTTSTSGLVKNNSTNSGTTVFYPNPANELVKLNYTLPSDYKKAFIRIQDAQGKVVDSYEVTSDFSNLLIPASYQNGLYLYTLEVDGSIIKTEKIIVSK